MAQKQYVAFVPVCREEWISLKRIRLLLWLLPVSCRSAENHPEKSNCLTKSNTTPADPPNAEPRSAERI